MSKTPYGYTGSDTGLNPDDFKNSGIPTDNSTPQPQSELDKRLDKILSFYGNEAAANHGPTAADGGGEIR